MKTFIVDSSNALFATNEPLPPNFQRLTIESNILAVLESDSADAYCIVYPSLSRLLANSIVETGQVALSQSNLLVAMEQIVQFYKRNRKCCTLLYLAEHNLTEQHVNQPETFSTLLSQISTTQNSVAEFIAASSLLVHKEFSKRLAELESCSCGEVAFELQVNAQQGVDAVFALQNENQQKLANAEREIADTKAALVKEQQARAADQKTVQKIQTETQQQVQELEQENKQIIEQLHNVQELFEEKLELLDQTKQKLADAETEIQNTKAALAKEQQERVAEQKAAQKIQTEIQQQVQELEQENKQIIEQLHNAQELFEEKQQQLKAQLTETEQENEQLIEQLHYVQELIEQEYKNKALQQKQIKTIRQDRSVVFKHLEDARQAQAWLRSALTNANQRLWSKDRAFRTEIKRQAKVLQESSEFVAGQYTEMYPDTKSSSLEPAVHYLLFGAIEARNPSTTFHSLNYIQAYADVAELGQNPLLHYIELGKLEGRQPNPMQLRLPAPKD